MKRYGSFLGLAVRTALIGLIICCTRLLPAIAAPARAGDPADESPRDPEPIHLDLEAPGWEIEGDGAKVEAFAGRTALRLISGKATYHDLELLDGTIEFDLRVTPFRAFAYLYFRMLDDDEHEEIYFRPHKSLLPDASQYTPVYKGSSQWQLYHDARAT
ncbi:MAG: hypothetical protein O7A04_02265, partial [Acidobacteria bacterium]|nr:hypothetical protein [Acidobacteriota bacterium]